MATNTVTLPFTIGLGLSTGPVVLPSSKRKVLWAWRRSVKPGESINIAGAISTTAQLFLTSALLSAPIQLTPYANSGIATQCTGAITAQIPASLGMEHYELFTVDGSVTSESIFVNVPSPDYASDDEFVAGGLLEFFGNNLQLLAGKTRVWLVPTDQSGPELEVTLNTYSSTKYYLRGSAPAGAVAGKAYNAYVSNGYGNGKRVMLPHSLTCLAPGTDYTGLASRLATATKYTQLANVYKIGPGQKDSRLPANINIAGNGTTDDTSAINALLSWVKNNAGALGGTLQLQEAKYFITNTLLIPGLTCLDLAVGPKSAYVTPPTAANGKYIFAATGPLAVLRNPQWTSNSTTSTARADLWGGFNFGSTTEVLVLGGTLDLKESPWLLAQNATRFRWFDTTVKQGAAVNANPRRGPAGLSSGTGHNLNGLKIYSTIDAMDLTYCNGTVVQRCEMTWDAGLGNRQAVVNHFWTCTGCVNFYFQYNTLKATYVGDPKTLALDYHKTGGMSANDGEGVISEITGDDEHDNPCGIITAATEKTLTCPGLNLASFSYPRPVCILAGKGAYQRRVATSCSGDTLTISEAWDVIPDTTSRFTGCRWTLTHSNIVYNDFSGLKRGILLYHAHTQFVNIDGNKLSQSGCIDISPRYGRDGNVEDQGAVRITCAFELYIQYCPNDGTGDTANGAGTALHCNMYVQNNPWGCQAVVPYIGYCDVTSNSTNQDVLVDAPIKPGISAYTEFQSNGRQFVDNADIPVIIGAIIERCRAIGNKQGITTSSGVHNVLVRECGLKGNAAGVTNELLDRANRRATNFVEIGTYTITDAVVAPTNSGTSPSFNAADTTLGRVDTNGSQVISVGTDSDLRNYLAANLSNTVLKLLDRDYVGEFANTGSWDNVWLTSDSGNARLINTGYSTSFIFNNSALRRRVRLSGFKIYSDYAQGGNQQLWWTELPQIDGLEIDHLDISSGGKGAFNAIGGVQYSTSSNSGSVAKNLWIHDNKIHDIGRCGIELLSQGYDGTFRLLNAAIEDNVFDNLGLQDQYGMAVSLSGLFKQVGVNRNTAKRWRRIAYEFVNTQQANVLGNVATGGTDGVGYGISDDAKGFTADINIVGGLIEAPERPFYINESKRISIDPQGNQWKGHLGMTIANSVDCRIKNLNALVQHTDIGSSFEVQGGTTGLQVSNSKISSAGSAAAGFNPAFEEAVIRNGATSNSFVDVETELGRKSDGTTYADLNSGGDGAIVNQGGNTNTITNNKHSTAA